MLSWGEIDPRYGQTRALLATWMDSAAKVGALIAGLRISVSPHDHSSMVCMEEPCAARKAVLHEFADDQAREREIHQDLNIADDSPYDQLVTISPLIVNVLDWLIRHAPATAGHAIQEIIG